MATGKAQLTERHIEWATCYDDETEQRCTIVPRHQTIADDIRMSRHACILSLCLPWCIIIIRLLVILLC